MGFLYTRITGLEGNELVNWTRAVVGEFGVAEKGNLGIEVGISAGVHELTRVPHMIRVHLSSAEACIHTGHFLKFYDSYNLNLFHVGGKMMPSGARAAGLGFAPTKPSPAASSTDAGV
ncbi:hypothetical protein OIU79_004995 [Salix purpurea]|uniref:Uncharacterized protein n=1 Tax=Salix purpurea TaxID=77065 RepID=A0A9Q0ZA78_SALPP|nr:hypothetical protein OIU79_004995 [Salix purpurea]